MNKARKAQAKRVAAQLRILSDGLWALMCAERAAYEATPESLRDGWEGQARYEVAEQLESAWHAAEEAWAAVGRALESAEEARGRRVGTGRLRIGR